MFDNTFYNGGFVLTMDEQNDFIDVLKGVPSFANFYNAGESYTPYVPFVLELFPKHIKSVSMVGFFTILSLLHVCLARCLIEASLQLFLHDHGMYSTSMTTPLKVGVMVT